MADNFIDDSPFSGGTPSRGTPGRETPRGGTPSEAISPDRGQVGGRTNVKRGIGGIIRSLFGYRSE